MSADLFDDSSTYAYVAVDELASARDPPSKHSDTPRFSGTSLSRILEDCEDALVDPASFLCGSPACAHRCRVVC